MQWVLRTVLREGQETWGTLDYLSVSVFIITEGFPSMNLKIVNSRDQKAFWNASVFPWAEWNTPRCSIQGEVKVILAIEGYFFLDVDNPSGNSYNWIVPPRWYYFSVIFIIIVKRSPFVLTKFGRCAKLNAKNCTQKSAKEIINSYFILALFGQLWMSG